MLVGLTTHQASTSLTWLDTAAWHGPITPAEFHASQDAQLARLVASRALQQADYSVRGWLLHPHGFGT